VEQELGGVFIGPRGGRGGGAKAVGRAPELVAMNGGGASGAVVSGRGGGRGRGGAWCVRRINARLGEGRRSGWEGRCRGGPVVAGVHGEGWGGRRLGMTPTCGA
jgi:hypothetical protein